MDLTAAFVLSVLGGYCFAYIWRATSFGTQRAEGNHLYFRAAVCGVMLFVLAFCTRAGLSSISPTWRNIDWALVEYIRPALKLDAVTPVLAQKLRSEWVVTAAYSLVLGISCALLANRFTPASWALGRSLSTFDKLLLRSYLEEIQVSLTLNTGKVYVGQVAEEPNPVLKPVAVSLLPRYSGHRDAAGQLILDTDYAAVFLTFNLRRDHLTGALTDWNLRTNLQIRGDEIVSAAIFSQEIHDEFNPNWRRQLSPRNQVLSSMGTNLRFSGPI
jgi:hypothetical protein